jgi:antitoxin MazE
MEFEMKVSKWGNSLAIRLPADVVAKLGVKEGDEVDAVPGFSEEAVTLKRKKTREEMWARVDEIRKKINLPPGKKFTRADAYEDDEY